MNQCGVNREQAVACLEQIELDKERHRQAIFDIVEGACLHLRERHGEDLVVVKLLCDLMPMVPGRVRGSVAAELAEIAGGEFRVRDLKPVKAEVTPAA